MQVRFLPLLQSIHSHPLWLYAEGIKLKNMLQPNREQEIFIKTEYGRLSSETKEFHEKRLLEQLF